MPEHIAPERICPCLGLAEDRASRFSYPETAHLCFAFDQENTIPLEHQSDFCFSTKYQTCPRFVESHSEPQQVQDSLPSPKLEFQNPRFSPGLIVLWGLAGLIVGSLIMFSIFYFFGGSDSSQRNLVNNSADAPKPRPSASLVATYATPTQGIEEDISTPVDSANFLATPTATTTPEPGIEIYSLTPAAYDVGWVSSDEGLGNHFMDSYLYVGTLGDQVYNSAFQFDLSSVPRGAPIHSASVQLTGLRDDWLGIHNDQRVTGVWQLRLLAPQIDTNWRSHNYQDIFNAPVLQTLQPILSDQDLAAGKTNEFELSPVQIRILEERIIADEEPKLSFRIDGPIFGPDNLFAWDTGYGPQSQGNSVVLLLKVGQPPTTPPPYNYVLITSTPTPENVMTAAAVSVQMTAEATRIGTTTPIPSNFATVTPIPDYLVIVPTDTPENEVTATSQSVVATAEVLTTGTPTPFPPNAVTATPIPTHTPTPTATQPNYVLITSTPTPESIFVAATLSALATTQAQQIGTATPLPLDWVTPIVVTPTPTPINAATAQALAEVATAIAFTTGTPTPIPSNMVTATPTPVFDTISFILTPTPTPVVLASEDIPSTLLGKVLFRSDREEQEHIYVFDPETGGLGRLTDDWPYYVALEREAYSADTVYRTYTKKLLWTNVEVPKGQGTTYEPTTIFAIHYYDYKYKVERQVTYMGAGWAWNPVWSPAGNQIAFVSNDSADDEIWVINHDGTGAKRLTETNEAFNAREIGKDTFIPELNGHPSWSPDGKQIVFWSNRTSNRQLWIMNADGSDERLLMGWDNWTPYNDWDPVWVKYLEPAPPEDQER